MSQNNVHVAAAKKVHSFLYKADISKVFYIVVVLLYLILNLTSILLGGASLASDVMESSNKMQYPSMLKHLYSLKRLLSGGHNKMDKIW